MRRRDFLYNTGLLLPALLASPSLVMASKKAINAPLVIIHHEAITPAPVATVFSGLGAGAIQLNSHQVNNLVYTKNGFLVTTSDNNTFLTEKVIVCMAHRFHSSQPAVEVNTGSKTFTLDYKVNNNNKLVPECWFMNAKQFVTSQVTPFIDRSKHAIMYLSAS